MSFQSSFLKISWGLLSLRTILFALTVFCFQMGMNNYVTDTGRGWFEPAKSFASQEHQSGDLYAVVVGIAKYRDSKIPALKVSDNDAKSIAEFLRTQKNLFREIHVSLLVNEKATREALEKELYYKIRRAGKDDTVIIFLSGHGSDDPKNPGEFFFLPYDANSEFVAVGGIHMNRQWFLDKLDSKRVLIIADACHAGGFAGPGMKRLPPSLDKFMGQFKQSEGRVFITSSRADEYSLEAPEHSHSLFTHYLLEGLSGKAADQTGVVNLKSLYDYVYKMTKKASDGFQSPQMEGKAIGLFPVALVSPISEFKPKVDPNKTDLGMIHQLNNLEQLSAKERETVNPVVTFSDSDKTREGVVNNNKTSNETDKLGPIEEERLRSIEKVEQQQPVQRSNKHTEPNADAQGIEPLDKVNRDKETQSQIVKDHLDPAGYKQLLRELELKMEQMISQKKESQKQQNERLSGPAEKKERSQTREGRTNTMEEQFKEASGNWHNEQQRKAQDLPLGALKGHNMDIWYLQRSMDIDAEERRNRISE